jgi:nucleotide-binding universal stress UspA family protein
MLPVHTILYPTDFSEPSGFAFPVACALARDYNARLLMLHVVPPPIVVYAGGVMTADPGPTVPEMENQLREMAAGASHVRVDCQVMEGDPVDMILRAAKEIHSDVIVMGTHGRTALSRLVMGSVAEAVLRKAPCPVLTIRGPVATEPADEPLVEACANA